VSILAADDFNRANGGVGAVSSDWVSVVAGMLVDSGAVQSTTVGASAAARWVRVLPPADQWVKATIKALSNSTCNVVLMARVSSITANRNFYSAEANGPFGKNASVVLRRQVANTSEALSPVVVTEINVNDTIMLEVVGPVLTLKINDVALITASDANHSSGYLGAWNNVDVGTLTDARMDDWQGGDFLNAAADPGVIRNVFKRPDDAAASASFVDGVTARKYRSIVG